MTEHNPILAHFFRHEAGQLTASLVRLLGVGQLETAQDIVQDTLLKAAQRWRYGAIPPNPAAWLRHVARNKALDTLRHRQVVHRAQPMLQQEAEQTTLPPDPALRHELADDMLRMMFICCHSSLPEASQIALILNTLCGFSAKEIALAFMIKTEAMEKRLSRAKSLLRKHNLQTKTQPMDLGQPLQTVYRALYLLFNEGYHGGHPQHTIRQELCAEALRLGALLLTHPDTRSSTSHALMALFCFQAARLQARVDQTGDLLNLQDQDRTRWNGALTHQAFAHLQHSAMGTTLTSYHLQAALAATHAAAPRWQDTDWTRIVALYQQLMAQEDSMIVRLNHAIALGQRDGAQAGLQALLKLPDQHLRRYPFWYAAQAEFLLQNGHFAQARAQFQQAMTYARGEQERRFWRKRIHTLIHNENF